MLHDYFFTINIGTRIQGDEPVLHSEAKENRHYTTGFIGRNYCLTLLQGIAGFPGRGGLYKRNPIFEKFSGFCLIKKEDSMNNLSSFGEFEMGHR
jgi:hypothetical protein